MPRFVLSTNAGQISVKLYEVTATDRSTLVDLVLFLGSRHFHPQSEFPTSFAFPFNGEVRGNSGLLSGESKFSLSKKLKPEKANAAIVMDF